MRFSIRNRGNPELNGKPSFLGHIGRASWSAYALFKNSSPPPPPFSLAYCDPSKRRRLAGCAAAESPKHGNSSYTPSWLSIRRVTARRRPVFARQGPVQNLAFNEMKRFPKESKGTDRTGMSGQSTLANRYQKLSSCNFRWSTKLTEWKASYAAMRSRMLALMTCTIFTNYQRHYRVALTLCLDSVRRSL